MSDQTPLDVEAIRARAEAFDATSMDNGVGAAYDSAADVPRLLDENARLNAENARLSTLRDALVMKLGGVLTVVPQLRKVFGDGPVQVDTVAHLLDQALPAAPEMPRPPAEEGCTCFPTDPSTWTTYGSAVEPGSMYEPNPDCLEHGEETTYMVVVPSIVGNLQDWRTDYSTDGIRKSTRDEAITHGLEVEGHDDWLIAIIVGDKLTGLAWQHEDRDDAEEVEEAAAALGLTAAFTMPVPAAQPGADGADTSPAGSGRGTGVTEAPGAQETERHWLKFNKDREITGCSCGFAADIDSDCGWGDSVVQHLIAAGHAEEAAALKESIRLDRAPSLPGEEA